MKRLCYSAAFGFGFRKNTDIDYLTNPNNRIIQWPGDYIDRVNSGGVSSCRMWLWNGSDRGKFPQIPISPRNKLLPDSVLAEFGKAYWDINYTSPPTELKLDGHTILDCRTRYFRKQSFLEPWYRNTYESRRRKTRESRYELNVEPRDPCVSVVLELQMKR